ncbi:MAG: minor capsid protein, partial [Trichococcus flocculiformis]
TKETRNSITKNAKRIVLASFYSATFAQRIWANQTKLINRLSEGLERSILQGENPGAWARNFRDLLTKEMADTGKENALYAANRIAVTETARVQSETAQESFRKGGFEKMIWITEMDERTCGVCGPMDGEIFDVDGAQIGGELPPMHPFCRCSVAAYYERDSEALE